MTDSPNSLADDIATVRGLLAAMPEGASPLKKDFYALLVKMCAAEEKFLFTRGELLAKSAVRDIARGIGLILVDVLKSAGIPNEARQRINQEVNARTGEMIATMNNKTALPAKRLG